MHARKEQQYKLHAFTNNLDHSLQLLWYINESFKHDNNLFTKLTYNIETLIINIDMLILNFSYIVKTNFRNDLTISNSWLPRQQYVQYQGMHNPYLKSEKWFERISWKT